jgi:putative chitinase
MLLKTGSSGDDVKKLQEKLGLKSDGSFGPGTEKAVKEWQTKNGFTADGIIGDKSWSKLFGEVKPELTFSPSEFKLEKLKGQIPDNVLAQIPDTAAKFGITTNLRLAHFLSQCAHESGNFKYTSELGGENYLKKYEGRKDLGNTEVGDGVKFKGRGYLQCTGRVNYKSLSEAFGVDFISNPELVSTDYPLSSAGWFFKKNKLWSICDKGSSDLVVKELTKRINGGYNGYDDRLLRFNKIWNILK